MARSDLLKRLFRGYKSGDHDAFVSAAREIVDDERKKAHIVLANELTQILDNGNGKSVRSTERLTGMEPLPKDADRGAPLAEIRTPERYLADLVVPESQRAILCDVLEEFRQWDVLETNGLCPSHRLLFCGPPGCGKTATSEAIATELGLPLLYVRFDAVVSSLLGETAANLRKVFSYAERGSWVVLFDEFDAIGRSRDDLTEHGEIKRVVNSFLQLLDGFRGRSLIIAATNFEQALDPALWRRFDEVLRFERPDVAQIEALLQRLLGHRLAPRVSLAAAARRLEGMAHADVERVCHDALRHHILMGTKVLSEPDLKRAMERQLLRRQTIQQIQGASEPSVDKE
jgi:ATP-dependent 26S proteasome regulatory subunit